MLKTITLNNPEEKQANVSRALSEVRMINSGKLQKRTAREFLKESRKNK